MSESVSCSAVPLGPAQLEWLGVTHQRASIGCRCTFRQLCFVKARLLTQLGAAPPELAKLTRELAAWCDREQAQRREQECFP